MKSGLIALLPGRPGFFNLVGRAEGSFGPPIALIPCQREREAAELRR